MRMDLARDMMTLAARASDTPFEENSPQFSNIPAVPFRLPDGTEVCVCCVRVCVLRVCLRQNPSFDGDVRWLAGWVG